MAAEIGITAEYIAFHALADVSTAVLAEETAYTRPTITLETTTTVADTSAFVSITALFETVTVDLVSALEFLDHSVDVDLLRCHEDQHHSYGDTHTTDRHLATVLAKTVSSVDEPTAVFLWRSSIRHGVVFSCSIVDHCSGWIIHAPSSSSTGARWRITLRRRRLVLAESCTLVELDH